MWSVVSIDWQKYRRLYSLETMRLNTETVIFYFAAIVSISIKTPIGNSLTANAALAGGFPE